MLLYNQKKEFIGIDKDDLEGLGFNNIGELQNESHDFADLFVKKPGFIHNFKNFSWIDFILHSETGESKAIIHAKGRNYSCTLHASPFHFTSNENGFAITIKNLRALSGSEDLQATQTVESSGGIKASTAAQSTQVAANINTPIDEPKPSQPKEELKANFELPPEVETSFPNFEDSPAHELSEPDPLDIPEPQEIDLGLSSPTENEFGAPVDIDYSAPLTLDDDVMMDLTPEPAVQEEEIGFDDLPTSAPTKKESPMLGDYVSGPSGDEHLSELVRSGTYVYEPQIAADELGLPVDLIEEFIGDFIDQAHEFHDDLYASVKTEDFDNVQILSHKLKGVAANLRVEDAFDVLSVVNSSKDPEEILPNLNQFYKIIAKLEGKELPEESASAGIASSPETQDEEMDLSISIKPPEDGPMLIDEDVTPISHPVPEEPSSVMIEEDDIYSDMLATPESLDESTSQESSLSESFEEDDLYDNLLSTSDDVAEPEAFAEAPMSETLGEEDDLYDNLLGTSDNVTEPEAFAEAPMSETLGEEDFLGKSNDLAEPEAFADIPMPDALEDDGLYDDLLDITDQHTHEEDTASAVDVATMHIDAERTANELGVPVDIVKDFIQDFKEQIAAHKANFDNALASQDIKGINKTATLLKGMSDNLRLNEISEVLKQLQQENNINNTAQALARLQAYADQL